MSSFDWQGYDRDTHPRHRLVDVTTYCQFICVCLVWFLALFADKAALRNNHDVTIKNDEKTPLLQQDVIAEEFEMEFKIKQKDKVCIM